jgi:DNA (cytosine-5)-methyltransferase 1
MMENVPGLKDRAPFRRLCADLRKLGYIISYDVKDAVDYGVPQRRKRLIVLGGRGFSIPFAPSEGQVCTVKQAIGGLSNPGRARDALHNMPQRRSARIVKLIKSIPKNGGSRGNLPRKSQLKCHQNFDGFSDVYGRMSWSAPSPTITSGCFNPSKGRFLHPQENRAITLREAAILQSFPVNYRFPIDAGKEPIALMIGNALPPKFIQSQALQILQTLKG